MFHVGQLSALEVILSEPFHYNILHFKSITNSPLVGMSAELSFVLIYLKAASSSDLISSIQFLEKIERDLLFLTQFSTYCESPNFIFFSIFKWIFVWQTSYTLMPIKTANSSSRAELIEFFFGASFVFEYRRCIKIFPELPVWI